MRLASIELNNFRNIAAMQLNAVPGVNVIHGENAQGKTNIIEAIWLFTGAKSFRGAKDKEMLRFGQKKCSVHTVFATAMREQTASIELFAPSQSLLEKSRSRSISTASRWKARRSLPGSFTRWSFRRRTCRWCGRVRPSAANSWTPPSASSCQSTAITCASISASCCSATPCSRTLPSFRSCRTRWMSGRKTWPKRLLRLLLQGAVCGAHPPEGRAGL